MNAYWYASGIVFSIAFNLIASHSFCLYALRTSSKVRIACSGLIYQKSLRLQKPQKIEDQNDQIIELLSNDLAKFDVAFQSIHEIWKVPLQVLLFLGVIYLEIGVAGIIGVAFLLGFVPLLGKQISLHFDALCQ